MAAKIAAEVLRLTAVPSAASQPAGALFMAKDITAPAGMPPETMPAVVIVAAVVPLTLM
jgi:hypothetical protein